MSDQSEDWVTISTPYLTPRSAGQDAWSGEAASGGRSGTQVLREVVEVAPPAEVSDALGLAPGETVVVRRRTMLLDGRPVELTDSSYPAAIARGTALAEHRKIPGGAVTLLAEHGFVAAEAVEDVIVRPATPDEAQELQLPPGSPVLVLFRTVYAADGAPFEATAMTMNPAGRRLRYTTKLG